MSRRLPYLGFDDLPRPAPLERPARPDGLWFNQNTECFEYWENGSMWELDAGHTVAFEERPFDVVVAAEDIAQGELVAVGSDGRLVPASRRGTEC